MPTTSRNVNLKCFSLIITIIIVVATVAGIPTVKNFQTRHYTPFIFKGEKFRNITNNLRIKLRRVV